MHLIDFISFRFIKQFVLFINIIISFLFAPQVQSSLPEPHAEDNAVILMYHNISDKTPSITSVTAETFKQHLRYLEENKFSVWPLSKVLNHLLNNKSVPARTVVLTFDDAYISVYTEAMPLLKKRNWPFTVFVTTTYISEANTHFMSWDQLREIQKTGGEIGNHSHSHAHLIRKKNNETDSQWRSRIINEINQAQTILKQQTGDPIGAVAYPYGEYSKAVKDIVRELGYLGFGQQSGAVSRVTDWQAIPRFPMAIGFDGLEDFALKTATKHLPVTILSPLDGVLTAATKIPELKLRLDKGDYKLEHFACYATGQGRIQIEWLERDKGVVVVKANEAIKSGRTKYNCTAPSKTRADVFYWFSFLWMKPEADGSWYKE